MSMPEPLSSQQSTVFPQEITVSLSLKVKVEDQEARDYFINSETNAAAVSFIADVFDMLGFGHEDVLTINNLTQTQVQHILQSEISL
jgi:hypothetical protein